MSEAWEAQKARLTEHEALFGSKWWNRSVQAHRLFSDDADEGKPLGLQMAMRVVSPDIRADFSVMPWYRAYLKAQDEKSDVSPAEATLPKTFAARVKHHLNPEHLCCRIYNALERTVFFGYTTPRPVKKAVRAGAWLYDKLAYTTISRGLDAISGLHQPAPCAAVHTSSPTPC